MEPTKAIEFLQHLVFWSVIASLVLPPIEVFDDFPGFQRYYRVFVAIINRGGALNVRGIVAEKYQQRRNGNSTPTQEDK